MEIVFWLISGRPRLNLGRAPAAPFSFRLGLGHVRSAKTQSQQVLPRRSSIVLSSHILSTHTHITQTHDTAAMLHCGFDGGTRNSAAAYLDARARLKHLVFHGGGVHTSSVPFVRTALQMLDATVQRLHARGLVYCSLANARVRTRLRLVCALCVPPASDALALLRACPTQTHPHTPRHTPNRKARARRRSGTPSWTRWWTAASSS